MCDGTGLKYESESSNAIAFMLNLSFSFFTYAVGTQEPLQILCVSQSFFQYTHIPTIVYFQLSIFKTPILN